MDAMENVKKSLYEGYKWLYEEAVANVKKCLNLAKERREWGKMGWAAGWIDAANVHYVLAKGYKRSMEFYRKYQ